MKKIVSVLLLVFFTGLLASCQDDSAPVISGGKELYQDQNYYPTQQATFWRYRIDTTGITGPTVRDVSRQTSRILGNVMLDSLEYTVQINETVSGITTTFDTVYVRKADGAVYFTSPMLQSFSLLPGLPIGNLSFPKEVLLLPNDLEHLSSWSIMNFEFNQIPLFPIYFRVAASYMGKETVLTDFRTFKECARITIAIDARLPNLQNPTDFLNPTIIKETASFWLSRPFGLIAADGSQAVFTLMAGRIPFNIAKRRIHQEVMGMDIMQDSNPCGK